MPRREYQFVTVVHAWNNQLVDRPTGLLQRSAAAAAPETDRYAIIGRISHARGVDITFACIFDESRIVRTSAWLPSSWYQRMLSRVACIRWTVRKQNKYILYRNNVGPTELPFNPFAAVMTSKDVQEDQDSVCHHAVYRCHVCWWPGMAG